jgi:pimeloyl-ACP methyl ester carboxylesterase
MNIHTGSRTVLLVGIAASLVQGCNSSDDTSTVLATEFNCEAIAQLPLSGHVKVTQARRIDANTVKPLPSAGFLPAHCLVVGQINARTGKAFSTNPATRAVSVVDAPYAIGFELRLPKDWNGRFFFQGGGGLDGVLNAAYGLFDPQQGPASNALSRGFTVVSTDGGHIGTSPFDGSFGADQQARLDYAYNAVDQVTLTAKDVLRQYYGKGPDKSYFVGCSNGGRQAMMASQRFPSHFDGIVAGDPGFNYMKMVSNTLTDVLTLAAIVPAGAMTPLGPDIGKAYSAADRALIGTAILGKCDVKGRDTVRDGIVSDSQACDFNPVADIPTCSGANDGTCLSAGQQAALAAMAAGGRTSNGTPLYSDYPYDAGMGTPGWNIWKFDGIPVPLSPTLTLSLGLNQLAAPEGPGKVFATPAETAFNPFTFDPDTYPARMAEFDKLASATSTDLSTFKARGGKLIIYNGNSDPLVSSKDLARYYQALAAANAGDASGFARLFLVPGMTHCSGGPATDGFDPLAAVQAWVEQGQAPDAIVARAGPATPWPGRQRPLCPHPKVAAYKGSGSLEDAASFTCQ